jgi:hypothetical protein
MTFGGGGGGCGATNKSGSNELAGISGAGGSIIAIFSKTTTVTGTIISAGQDGSTQDAGESGGSAGAGGSVLIKSNIATLGTDLVTALKGNGSAASAAGANGADGRIALHYGYSYTGTTDPTLDTTQDASLKDIILGGIV